MKASNGKIKRLLAQVRDMAQSAPSAPIVCVQLRPLPSGKHELEFAGVASASDMIALAFELLHEARAIIDDSDHPLCNNCIWVKQAANAGLAALTPFAMDEPADKIGEPQGNA